MCTTWPPFSKSNCCHWPLLQSVYVICLFVLIRIMSIFLEHLSIWNMHNFAEQVQILKYKTHACKTAKTADVQIVMLKHPTKQLKKKKKKKTFCELKLLFAFNLAVNLYCFGVEPLKLKLLKSGENDANPRKLKLPSGEDVLLCGKLLCSIKGGEKCTTKYCFPGFCVLYKQLQLYVV